MRKINWLAAIALLIILTLLFPQEWQAAEASARCDRFSPKTIVRSGKGSPSSAKRLWRPCHSRELAKAKDKVATFNTNRGTR
jgi:hypothetical protein